MSATSAVQHAEMSQRTRELLESSRTRARAVQGQKWMCSPKEFNWTHAFFELYRDEPPRLRQALAFAHTLKSEPVVIFDDCRLVMSGLLTFPERCAFPWSTGSGVRVKGPNPLCASGERGHGHRRRRALPRSCPMTRVGIRRETRREGEVVAYERL